MPFSFLFPLNLLNPYDPSYHKPAFTMPVEVPKTSGLLELLSLKGKVVVVTGASGPRGQCFTKV